jgi:hypothetical protein
MRHLFCGLLVIFGLCALPVKADVPIELIPTFESCSVYLDQAVIADSCTLSYRPKGDDAWQIGLPMVRTENNPQWRSSILGLQENQTYEVKITTDKQTWQSSFTTWQSQVPIARTITIDKLPITISEIGSATGWVRYVASDELNAQNHAEAAITIDKAEYVILEGLKIRGGQRHGIHVLNSSHVRILNCDIAQWGRVGKRNINARGVFYDENRSLINYDAGVYIDQSLGIVVERSYIHDPNGKANSWAFAHPAGPCAIYMYARGQTVIRYNDLIGSQTHRYNDIIEGNRNGFEDGGFCRDADIYGNMFILGNDDCIELDGGQMNIRVWGNNFSNTLCGVSTAPSIFGPTYIYNNLFSQFGDQNNLGGTGIKNGYKFAGQGMIYLYHNTFDVRTILNNFGKSDKPRRYIVSRNNIYQYSNQLFGESIIAEKNDFDSDLIFSDQPELLDMGIEAFKATNFAPNAIFQKPQWINRDAGNYRLKSDTTGSMQAKPIAGLPIQTQAMGMASSVPIRPVDLAVDQAVLELKAHQAQKIKVTLAGEQGDFHIRKNDAFGWFEVTPMQGKLTNGKPIELTVKLKEHLPVDQQRFKGCFQITLANGISRPVTVYAGQDQLVMPSTSDPRVVTIIEAEDGKSDHDFLIVKDDLAYSNKAIALPRTNDKTLDTNRVLTYRFSIPQDGTYFLAARTKAYHPVEHHNSVYVSLDNSAFAREEFWANGNWYWCGMRSFDPKGKTWFPTLKLKAGEHTLQISPRESLSFDCIAIVKDPTVLFVQP